MSGLRDVRGLSRRVRTHTRWWLSHVLGIGVAGLLMPLTLGADLLVMKDGSQIETRGDWKVDGPRILFETTTGTYASIRTESVDLDASRQQTSEAKRRAETQSAADPPEPEKAVFILTDDDVSHPKSSRAGSDTESPGAVPDAVGANEEVVVTSWNSSDTPNQDGIQIVGNVRNDSANVVADLIVVVSAYDSTDTVMASVPAGLGARALGPGQSTSLAAELGGVFSYSRVEFEIDFSSLARRPDAEPATSTRRPETR